MVNGNNHLMLSKAIIIATEAHLGQVDKAGEAYILHPLRVMMSLKDYEHKIVAVLHDVLEDTLVSTEDLRLEGFNEKIIEALIHLTRRKNESYEEFIDRVIKNPIATAVKLADIKDNMDLSRLANPTEDDYIRFEKYERAEKRLLSRA